MADFARWATAASFLWRRSASTTSVREKQGLAWDSEDIFSPLIAIKNPAILFSTLRALTVDNQQLSARETFIFLRHEIILQIRPI
jgi:hypothetical protein